MGQIREIEETIGTGLATLLAKNLRLADFELPEHGHREGTDLEAITKLREVLGKGKIVVTAKTDGSFVVKVPGGTILLLPE